VKSFPPGDLAIVIGASGGIGAALVDALRRSDRFAQTIGLGRASVPALQLHDEASIAACAAYVRDRGVPRLVVVATGILQSGAACAEKSWRQLDPTSLAEAFAVNAIGPALLMKHFMPLLPPRGKAVFAALSARVGSISDNRLGGWYSYRASKAALNQLVRCAAVELARSKPEARCVALHPGTVATELSAPFRKAGLDVQTPADAAGRLLDVIDSLSASASGGFFDNRSEVVSW